jgi:hypothetical protein
MRHLLIPLAALSIGLVTSPARAEFGNQGDVSFGADRLMGIWIHDEGGFDGTGFGLGLSPGFGAYSTARFGFDFVVVDHLTIGGNLGLVFYGGDADGTGILVYPRVGYVIAFDDTWGFWPRGGITILHADNDFRRGGDDEVALTFEATFFAAAVEHFGFTFGPAIDIGLAGDGDEARSFGVVAGGVFGWL